MKKHAGWKKRKYLDYPERLAHYRRYADPRYYKGVEYADVVEALARRRCAEAFATPPFRPTGYLSMSSRFPARRPIMPFTLPWLNPGDTILGMNLLHGGHLTHGSSVNRSGKLFKVVHYDVDPANRTDRLRAVQALASEHKPKIIIAGYSSYSWVPDWQRFRAIADSVGAVLLADISHIAGLVARVPFPARLGIAQVITFTTHKTLTGPRGAVIITTDAALARKIDRAVFPGEQGGPHVHMIRGPGDHLQTGPDRTIQTAAAADRQELLALNDRLAERGFRMVFGGTDTHLTNLDCKTIKGPDGTTLSGDMAARILDIAGLVHQPQHHPGR